MGTPLSQVFIRNKGKNGLSGFFCFFHGNEVAGAFKAAHVGMWDLCLKPIGGSAHKCI